MPTLDDWRAAIRTPRDVVVESSHRLVDEVRSKQDAKHRQLMAQRKAIPASKPRIAVAPGLLEEQVISVIPAHLLHRLGVITTPPVENLADICSTWAYIRYLWAFEPPTGHPGDRLRLSEPAKSIDFHQKGLMSDQIGVGMAAIIMEHFYGVRQAADVDVAMADGAWQIDLVETTSPDYIFSNEDRTQLYVVECKGTRCARNDVLNQLRRGLEQVPSLVFLDGRPRPTSLVIGTQLTDTEVRVYVIDPPEDFESDSERPRKVSSRDWEVPKSEFVEITSRSIAHAKALSFAGADTAAAEVMNKIPGRPVARARVRSRETSRVENEYGVFAGIRQGWNSPDGMRIEVFQGIEETFRDAYVASDVDRVKQRESELLQRFKRTQTPGLEGQRVAERVTHNGIVIQSVAGDGTIFELGLME